MVVFHKVNQRAFLSKKQGLILKWDPQVLQINLTFVLESFYIITEALRLVNYLTYIG